MARVWGSGSGHDQCAKPRADGAGDYCKAHATKAAVGDVACVVAQTALNSAKVPASNRIGLWCGRMDQFQDGQHVTNGEILAQAALQFELLICNDTNVPYAKYIGRPQYPLIETVPAVGHQKINDKFTSPAAIWWATLACLLNTYLDCRTNQFKHHKQETYYPKLEKPDVSSLWGVPKLRKQLFFYIFLTILTYPSGRSVPQSSSYRYY